MKELLTILFILISIGSNAQIEQLTIDFYPSFIGNSQLLIDNKNDGYLMTLKYEDIQDEIEIPDAAVNNLNSFLSGYEFQHKNSIDTIEIIETIRNGDTIVQHVISMGTDGITVKGELKNRELNRTFDFWSPDKGTENHDLIELIFDLMITQFSKHETITYLEQLEQYFDFGLGLKKISGNPLEYKLYGSLTSSDEAEIVDFFNELSKEQRITIDVTNLSGMGTMFYDIIGELIEGNTNIYWRAKNNTSSLYHLRKIGVPDEHIISNYRIKKIREDKYSKKIKYKKI